MVVRIVNPPRGPAIVACGAGAADGVCANAGETRATHRRKAPNVRIPPSIPARNLVPRSLTPVSGAGEGLSIQRLGLHPRHEFLISGFRTSDFLLPFSSNLLLTSDV